MMTQVRLGTLLVDNNGSKILIGAMPMICTVKLKFPYVSYVVVGEMLSSLSCYSPNCLEPSPIYSDSEHEYIW